MEPHKIKKGDWVQRLPQYQNTPLWIDLSRRLNLPPDHIYRCHSCNYEEFYPGDSHLPIKLEVLMGHGSIALDVRNFVAVSWWDKTKQWLRGLW